jgi:hypothetical protein
MAAKVGDTFHPGQQVLRSGIYAVIHKGHEVADHEVTCVSGREFPPCRDCGKGVTFKLVRAAKHVRRHKYFGDQ